MTDDISKLLTPEFHKFVRTNTGVSPDTLRLKYHGSEIEWMPIAINHIECEKKAKGKFATMMPELMVYPLSVEQATSEAVARLHGEIAKKLLDSADCILDMTCGMGIDLRALQEALKCDAVGIEQNELLSQATAYNFRNNPKTSIIKADSVEWLESYSGARLDLIFLDPARRDKNGGRVYNIHDCHPDVAMLLPLLKSRCKLAMVKLSPMLDVSQTLRDLPSATELHIVDEGGDCRELLAVIDFEHPSTTPLIIIHSGENRTLSFCQNDESSATAIYGEPAVREYLFEPSPAAMKAQPFNLLSQRYHLRKLAQNTHLYCASEPVENLPGKWHRVEQVFDFKSSTAKEIGKVIGRADVAVRNFPLKADELQKKLKVKSGGEVRLIGTEISSQSSIKRKVVISLKK